VASDADPDPAPCDAPASTPIVVPELRDYHQINAELVRRLNRGDRHVRLDGVAGQRLLVQGLRGSWQALVEIVGDAGPELAAGLDAPGLTVVCRGPAADGAGRAIESGRLVILRQAGTALGYAQRGGLIVAAGGCGPRAGLQQRGGDLIVLGRAGSMAGERQSGGRLFLARDPSRRHDGRGRRGGRLVLLDRAEPDAGTAPLDPDDRRSLDEALALLGRLGTSGKGWVS
jgi:glutamate synthase domain-containing protein 3